VFARVGSNLGATHRRSSQNDQFRFLGDPNDLDKQSFKCCQMPFTEITDGSMPGKIACCQYPEGYVFLELPGDFAGQKCPRRVGVLGLALIWGDQIRSLALSIVIIAVALFRGRRRRRLIEIRNSSNL
jgi:hypothetical protein